MDTLFVPGPKDVERYRRLRALSMGLGPRMIKAVPREAFSGIGDAIGVLHDEVLVFGGEASTSAHMDCCLYDWFENGKNTVQRYAEMHAAQPGTDERLLLDACAQAKYRVLVVESAVPGAGVHCHNVLNDEKLFLMDVGLSRSVGRAGGVIDAFATRTLSLGEYCMTSGAALPLHKAAVPHLLNLVAKATRRGAAGPGKIPLLIVRACLAAGAADHIAYDDPAPISRRPRR